MAPSTPISGRSGIRCTFARPRTRAGGGSEGWWAESPGFDGWAVVGGTYEDVRRLAEDGVSFTLASANENRGEAFDEAKFATVRVEHYVPASA